MLFFFLDRYGFKRTVFAVSHSEMNKRKQSGKWWSLTSRLREDGRAFLSILNTEEEKIIVEKMTKGLLDYSNIEICVVQ